MKTNTAKRISIEGALDSCYQKIGGMPTCQQISERFHDRVADDPVLKAMFPKNLTAITEHFTLFLAETLGGPADYKAKRGKQSLLCRHAPFPIGAEEGERWLGHMFATLEEVGLPEQEDQWLRDYFTQTAATLADPFLPLYNLPLNELRARLQEDPALATAESLGRTLIGAAARAWDLPRLQLLLEHGANVGVQDKLGHDPLYHAAGVLAPDRAEEGRAVVALLLEHGANVNSRSGPGRMTPLHMAARRGTVAVAEVLLTAGAEMEAKDIKGETPLRRAVNCGQERVVRLLLAHGADPLSRDRQGRIPLDVARSGSIRDLLQENE